MKKSLFLFIIIFLNIYNLFSFNEYSFVFNSYRGATSAEHNFFFQKMVYGKWNFLYTGNLKKYKEKQFARDDNYSKNKLSFINNTTKLPSFFLEYNLSKLNNSTQKYNRYENASLGISYNLLNSENIKLNNEIVYISKENLNDFKDGISAKTFILYNYYFKNFELKYNSSLKVNEIDEEKKRKLLNNFVIKNKTANYSLTWDFDFVGLKEELDNLLFSDSLKYQKKYDFQTVFNYSYNTLDWLEINLQESFNQESKELSYKNSSKHDKKHETKISFDFTTSFSKIDFQVFGNKNFAKDLDNYKNSTKKIGLKTRWKINKRDSLLLTQYAKINQNDDLTSSNSSNDKYTEYWQLSSFYVNNKIELINHLIYKFDKLQYLDANYSAGNELKELYRINSNINIIFADNFLFKQKYNLTADYTEFAWGNSQDRLFRNAQTRYELKISDHDLREEYKPNYNNKSFSIIYKLDLSDNGFIIDDKYLKSGGESKTNSIGCDYQIQVGAFYLNFNPNINFYNKLIEKEYYSSYRYELNENSFLKVNLSARGYELDDLIYKADFIFRYFY